MSKYNKIKDSLVKEPKTWLITGVAGFIGSNLLEELLKLNQNVIGADNYSTGFQSNLTEVQKKVSKTQWKRFVFNKGDISKITKMMPRRIRKAGPGQPFSGPTMPYFSGNQTASQTLGRFNAEVTPSTVRLMDTYDMENKSEDPDF